MKHNELIDKVRNLYLEARKEKFQAVNVSRCTSHSISSELEDLLAYYCSLLINDSSISLYIDPQISFFDTSLKNMTGRKALLYRPDILIVKNGKARVLIDVKTDFGYGRTNYLTKIKEQSDLITRITGHSFRFKDGSRTPIEGEFFFSERIKLTYFVASNRYISKGNTVDVDAISQLMNVNVFFLSKGAHLNNYKNSDFEIDEASMSDFDRYIIQAMDK